MGGTLDQGPRKLSWTPASGQGRQNLSVAEIWPGIELRQQLTKLDISRHTLAHPHPAPRHSRLFNRQYDSRPTDNLNRSPPHLGRHTPQATTSGIANC